MNCIECGNKMDLISTNDTGSGGHKDAKSYAYNVYECVDCLHICRENVWEAKGVIWIKRDQV